MEQNAYSAHHQADDTGKQHPFQKGGEFGPQLFEPGRKIHGWFLLYMRDGLDMRRTPQRRSLFGPAVSSCHSFSACIFFCGEAARARRQDLPVTIVGTAHSCFHEVDRPIPPVRLCGPSSRLRQASRSTRAQSSAFSSAKKPDTPSSTPSEAQLPLTNREGQLRRGLLDHDAEVS